jgi:hypothetical protein
MKTPPRVFGEPWSAQGTRSRLPFCQAPKLGSPLRWLKISGHAALPQIPDRSMQQAPCIAAFLLMKCRLFATMKRGHLNPGTALAHLACSVQDLQFFVGTPTIRNRNRPAKQVGNQRWLNLHSTNRSSTRSSVLCAVSASPECLMNRGELHRLRTGSPAHCPRPSGPAFYYSAYFSSVLQVGSSLR